MIKVNNDEVCPKCGGVKYPFDIHCDDCYEFSVAVDRRRKLKMEEAIIDLGYKFTDVFEKGNGSWLPDRFFLIVQAKRDEELTIKQILKELT